jgi:tripartite-type tricarboxylate transporter receptor subunit TctC
MNRRFLCEKMQAALGQPVVIDNKAGAGGNLGAAEVARAAPDGQTWLFGTDTLLTVNPHVYKSLPFKTDDLLPVSIASRFSQTQVCHPSVGVKTLAELMTKAGHSAASPAGTVLPHIRAGRLVEHEHRC